MNEKVFKDIERLRLPERLERLDIEEVIESLKEHKILSILDVGVGNGVYAERFVESGFSVKVLILTVK